MSNIEPTPFGEKYVLVEHIATGGMAEIYRAQYRGIEGFAKELVVKVLRDEFAARPDVVQMFLDEARVAATLTHNNVVHTYDLGEIDGEYFIAMELLKGEELVNLLRRAHQLGIPLPDDVIVGTILQALEGLHYVHSHTDERGEMAGLVHRDINPTNLHIGYDGVCKILDFGIAATRASALATKGIAGKLSYMAPEQLAGQPLDARADIFAVGVLLYEMALGRRLFRGPHQEVADRIRRGDIPAPTFVERDFPPALEAVIMRALEVDPTERYQNADHMFRDLDAYAREAGISWTPRRLSAFMLELFGEGAPAEINYDDEYADFSDGALDFDAYDNLEEAPSVDDKPDWVRKLESQPDAETATQRKRAMTIGSLEAFVARDEPPVPPAKEVSGPAPVTVDAAESGVGRASPIPRASETTKARRLRSGPHTSGRRAIVPTGEHTSPSSVSGPMDGSTASGIFGHGVVREQQKGNGALMGWLFGFFGAVALLYFAYSVFTAK